MRQTRGKLSYNIDSKLAAGPPMTMAEIPVGGPPDDNEQPSWSDWDSSFNTPFAALIALVFRIRLWFQFWRMLCKLRDISCPLRCL